MFYTECFKVDTCKDDVINITESVKAVIAKSNIKNGIVVVEVPHTTAGVMTTIEYVKDSHEDLMEEIKKLVPSRIDFRHKEPPDDASGHVKCGLFGNSISSILVGGKLVSDGRLGYLLMEYDGPRARKYHVAVFGEGE